MLLLYAIGIGLLVGRAAGGRVSALADIHIRWWGLAVGGLLFQVLLFGPLATRIGDAGPALYVASSLARVHGAWSATSACRASRSSPWVPP